MVCPHCQGAEDVFSQKYAERELEAYRKNGASKSTQVLLDTFKELGVSGKSLLDIGGGVGVIPLELFPAGLSQAIDVDASGAYIATAKRAAAQRDQTDKIDFRHGDFIQLAPTIESADIVTLDRVVCCYPDAEALVDLSSRRAREFYALVFPRDNLLTRNLIHVFNFFAFRIWGNPFRTFIHDTRRINQIVKENGLVPIKHKRVGLWQVFIYRREADSVQQGS